MSDMQDLDVQDQAAVKKRLELKGFSREQAQAVHQMATQMAAQQARRAVAATSSFLTTVVTLVSSAVGFVAAFAWNDALQAWLKTQYNAGDAVQGKLIYALVATVFAVVVIGILGLIHGRLLKDGKNLINNPV